MTSINFGGGNEVLGFDIPFVSSFIARKKGKGISEYIEEFKSEIQKIAGTDYLNIVGHLTKAQNIFRDYFDAEKKDRWGPLLHQGQEKAESIYLENANAIYNLYRSALTSNNPEEVRAAIQNLTIERNALISAMHPATSNRQTVRDVNKKLLNLIKELQNYGREISQEQRALTKRVVEAQTGGGGGGGGLTKLILPVAIGAGAWMLLKG